MKELTIGEHDAGMRLDRYLSKTLPALPGPLAQKYIRTKKIKVNGKRAEQNRRLCAGDKLQCYIRDEFFLRPERENTFLADFHPKLDILYEDENLLLVNKAPGIVCHGNADEKINTLIHHIRAYLFQTGAWNPEAEHSFTPALCNRLDRNTGGIVIAAKNARALRVLNQKIRDREIEKYYLCLVSGLPAPPNGTLHGYLTKNETKNQVSVRTQASKGEEGKEAITNYRTLTTDGKLSLVECELVTGRSHQIRAMLSRAGHPILGDPKYGNPGMNRQYALKYQALWSWRLVFSFTTPADVLEKLNGMCWQVPHVDFAEQFFPDFTATKLSQQI